MANGGVSISVEVNDMAKLSAHGRILHTAERNGDLYRVMEDGIILKSFRYSDGKQAIWTILTRKHRGNASEALAIIRKWEARS